MQTGKKDFRDLLFTLIGVAGIICYFYTVSAVHPYRMAEVGVPKGEIISRADSILQSWQYQMQSFYPIATFESESKFLDSLQRKVGKREIEAYLKESEFLNTLPVYHWQVNQMFGEEDGRDINLTIGLDTEGQVVNLNASNNLITKFKPFNREAIRSVYQNDFDNYSRTLGDSLVKGLLDFQHLNSSNQNGEQGNGTVRQFRSLQNKLVREFYKEDRIWELAGFYLDRSAWKTFDLQKDSVHFMDDAGIRFARAFLSASDAEGVVTSSVTLDLLPAGSLKNMSFTLSPQIIESESTFSGILDSIALLTFLVFVIWLVFIFYLRIKARAIDTRPAMIVAVLAGFAVPGFFFLQFLSSFGFVFRFVEITEIINGMMVLGVIGAVTAVGFFVLTAVSDSITRQHWPEKLKSWDLIRRGLFINKPVGWAIVNAIGIGGLLAGITGLFLNVIPSAYLPAGTELLSNNYFLPSLANLLTTLITVLILIVSIYLIIGNHVKSVVNKNFIIPLLSAILFGLMEVLPFNFEPELLNRLSGAVTGLLLGYFYLRFDFLTVVLGFFVYLNFLTTSTGWVISGSPDSNTFYLFMLVLIFASAFGIYFVAKGSDRKELPEYVPSYIEDQAKEQRIKQELSIARVVQQTFLPSKIQSLTGIDMAGICIPAQETGGDYYDMISLGEQRIAIAIGDVSGKGIRASFYMTFTKGVLHSLSALILSPVELLNQLNRLFNENATRGTFISMIYGILEAKKRTFTFARAGHNPMLLVKRNGDTEWIKPKGLGIGVAKRDEFIKETEEAELKLAEGDVLILYTDGITEMLDTGGRFYGEERLEELAKNLRKESSETIMKRIVSDVNEFKGLAKQHDDMTLVIIKADASANKN